MRNEVLTMEKIAKEQKEKFNVILEELNVEAEDLEYIIDYGYDIDTLYDKIIVYGDYSIFDYSSDYALGEELFQMYIADCYNVPNVLEQYFDYEAYAKDFIMESENIPLDDKLLVIY